MSNPEIIARLTAIEETGYLSGEGDHAALQAAIAILRRLEGMLPERREKVAGGEGE